MEDLKESIKELLNETELESMDKFSMLMELANEYLINS